MCGIAAIVKTPNAFCPAEALQAMRDEVEYRGPDDFGSVFFTRCAMEPAEVYGTSSGWHVGLAHRRLSILDLSLAGHQPMSYRNRFWITYNGEVYNYLELRCELERQGHVLRSRTDTEVILAAYAQWGPECFARMRGMWSLVIYDAETGETIACRDRLGIKPLYTWSLEGKLIAAVSEIKQLRHLPGFGFRLDGHAAREYLQTGYEDPSRTCFREVLPVPSGHWVRLDLSRGACSPPEPYWHPERVTTLHLDSEEAAGAFAEKFQESVRLHMRSDVPVGCALSGGLDSSAIAVTADHLSNCADRPLHTFTTTFPGDKIDERPYVNAVLARIRHEAHFDSPEPAGFLRDLDRLVWIHDEPVESASIYASYCLARQARRAGVPVLLSGQGGDELFGAYWPSYFLYLRGLLRTGHVIDVARQFVGAAKDGGGSQMVFEIPNVLRRYYARRRPFLRVRLPNGFEPKSSSKLLSTILNLDEQSRRIYEIRTMFLPRFLKWDDRNSMVSSVEGRYPFLDHELIELVLSFPGSVLYDRGWTKWPLRCGLRQLLPAEVAGRRTKFGFETPQLKWLRGFMRPELESWLRSDRPAWEYVRREDARSLFEQVCRNGRPVEERGQALFRIFTFDRWLSAFSVAS